MGNITIMGNPHVEYVAHHWLLLAGPAFLPAVIVVGAVLYVAIRDRRAGRSAGGAKPDSSKKPTDASHTNGD